MLYTVNIEGVSPLIQHSTAGLDPLLPVNVEKAEITRKRGSNRTDADDARLRQLETINSLWVDANERPTIPAAAIRSVIETGARKLKMGPSVREGLVVTRTDFHYDLDRYGNTLDALAVSTQHTVPVVVQRNRILRTRAKFDCPWSCEFDLDCDDELVSQQFLEQWLDIAGRRIGLGDWRPEKSGEYGRFVTKEIMAG